VPTLRDVLPEGTDPAVADTVARLAGVFAEIAHRIARGGIAENLADARGTNSDGDGQKALDVIADDAFRAALLFGLERGWPLARCAALGNRLGALKIASRGGQNHAVDRARLGLGG